MEYRKESLPKKSVAMKILSAYGGGVTNMTDGVEYTAFGRDREIAKFDQTLKMTANKSGRMDSYVGPYGVGKSFIVALFQNYAIKKGFVVMTADITRSAWFAGTASEKQGLNLYRELIRRTAIKGKTMGAFDSILENWYLELKERGDGCISSVMTEFDKDTNEYKDLPMYSNIRGAIFARFKEYEQGATNSKAMEFFLANLTKKTDAAELGAKDYIRESGWFNVLNTMSHLFVAAGYKGLIIMFDQVDYLLNLPKANRQQNYEALLTMWNDVNQGRTEYLSVSLFAADRLIDDEKKGTHMYEALDDRLMNSTRLDKLPNEQLVGLLIKLKEIHFSAYDWSMDISDEAVAKFVEDMIRCIESKNKNCVRPVSMAWLKKLEELLINSKTMETKYEDDNGKFAEIAKAEASRPEKIEKPIEESELAQPAEQPKVEFPDD